MERTKGSKQKPLWRKLTLDESPNNIGKLYLREFRKGMIKPNEKIRATEQELGRCVDEFQLVDAGDYSVEVPAVSTEEETKEELKVSKVPGEKYTVVHVGGGWYDVVSESNKVMNGSKLRSDSAQKLVNDLEQETIVEEEPE